MALAEISVEGLRCVEHAELRLRPGSNLIHGANGAGKTSLLEAVFLLGRGRSFRNRLGERLINHALPQLRVVGKISGSLRDRSLGVEVSREGGLRARLDAQNVRSLSELATAFPVQVLDPDSHRLIEDSSTRRRRWLDWAVFHVEPGFGLHWSRYSRGLQQRNAALRTAVSNLSAWDLELVKEGEHLSEARQRVITALQPYWAEVSTVLLNEELTLGFQAGWDRDRTLGDALTGALARDRLRKTTTVGPHRADVAIRIRGKPVREVLSRGQQKLAAVALTLCQLEYLKQEHGLKPTLLLDDPSAELDQAHLQRFIERVKALDTQLIVTALDRDYRLFGQPDAVFHVEHGRVTGG
mgnify:CR=1 FL=1